VVAEWRLQGYLKFPWNPHVDPYTGQTTFTLGSDGRITAHAEMWSISAVDAFIATAKPNPAPGPGMV
ncbi:unnamed protein product, partial [Phaeothamnion confervicola]